MLYVGDLREPPKRHRSMLICGTVILVSPHSCLSYKICLKAEIISSALGHVLRKISIERGLSCLSGELERPTLNPISGSAVLSHSGGQTKRDRVIFCLKKRKGASHSVILLTESSFQKIQLLAVWQPSGIPGLLLLFYISHNCYVFLQFRLPHKSSRQ